MNKNRSTEPILKIIPESNGTLSNILKNQTALVGALPFGFGSSQSPATTRFFDENHNFFSKDTNHYKIEFQNCCHLSITFDTD